MKKIEYTVERWVYGYSARVMRHLTEYPYKLNVLKKTAQYSIHMR